MPPSVDATLFFAGAAVIAWTLYRALRFHPRLAATGLKRHWNWLLTLMGVFVAGYLGVAALALTEHLEPLVNLTSIIFLLGAFFVYYTMFVTRSLTRDLESRVAERTAQLEDRNQQLLAAISEAQAATRTKSDFLANMSHEIRTPLTSILGYSDLLLRGAPDGEERLKHLRTIRRNGQHLLELINDVLDISKIEAGEMTVELLECSPWQLLREVRSLLRSQAQAKDLALEIEAAGPIPEYIRSDPVRLRQILLNLVGNAIKFTDAGQVRLVVRMEDGAGSDGTRLRFDVVDTGIGMTEEEKESLFLPFRQAKTSTARLFGGTGLGLTISRRLADMLGGDILVQSAAGEGSTFSLTVDAGTVDTDNLLNGPLRTETDQVPAATTAKVWNRRLGGRILLAEDGVDNRRLISAVLQQVGAEVTLVENGQQAVARALEARDLGQPYDAVLMDMQMPVLDGYEAVARLRHEGYEGTIVALTAYAMSGDREKCLEAGCDDFVAKPIDVESFLASLAEYVRAAPRRAARASRDDGVPRRPAALSGEPVAAVTAGEAQGPIVSSLANHPILGELVEGFVSRLPQRLDEIRSAFHDADLETLRSLAHGLRGAGGTYGLKPLTDAAEALETLLMAGAEQASIAAAVDQLSDVCHRVTT